MSMVDLGFGWDAGTLGAFDAVFTDDFEDGTRRTAESLNYEGISLRISASFLRSRRNGRTTAWLGAPSSLPGPAFRTWRLRPSCIAEPSKAMRGGSCLAEELRSLSHRAARARSLVASTARPFGARANRVGAYGARSMPGVSPVISRATARALGGPPVIPKCPWPNTR